MSSRAKRVDPVAIIGSGPAALMAADVVSEAGHPVTIYEKKKGPGRKLLIAGSSGLNVSNSLPLEEFAAHYTGPRDLWRSLLSDFPPAAWLEFIHGLGLETFEGTSGRYFVRGMKSSKLLRAWLNRLSARGVEFRFEHELSGLERRGESWVLRFRDRPDAHAAAVCLALGGGSYESTEKPLRWPEIPRVHGIEVTEFRSSNVGYNVAWSAEFLKEAEGLPLKNIVLTSPRGSRKGDLVITRYGLEGTPIYFVGETGLLSLDLKPDLTLDQVIKRLQAPRENLSPMRRIKKQLSLSPAALALIFHHAPDELLVERGAGALPALASLIKEFPLDLGESQPLDKAISSSGGVRLEELDPELMLRKLPGVFAAGEMLDWDAPTGGFLIQGCVSQGRRAGLAVLRRLSRAAAARC